MKKIILEICCGNIESAIAAAEGGADRIELCAALGEGGVTPSAGTIEAVVRELKIPVHVLVRPRGGDFCYAEPETQSMLRDIEICKAAGAAGIVTGVLLNNGEVDRMKCKLLIEHARPLHCTFHRAFDVAADPFAALEDIIDLGFERLLTSGQQASAGEGAILIFRLLKAAGDRIILMPGSGISENNLAEIAGQTGAHEFHMSLRSAKQESTRADAVLQTPPYMISDKVRVKKARALLDMLMAQL